PAPHVQQSEARLPGPDHPVVSLVRLRAASQDVALIRKDDGREVGDAGTDGEQAALLRRVSCDVCEHLRPWSDQAHLTPNHVPQLGEFVELPAAHEPAYRGDTPIVG